MNYIILDTETTNGLDDPMCYDIGWAIVDENFEIINTRSFVVADIFCGEKELMKTAFFADKIPQYWKDIKQGKRTLTNLYNIRKALKEDCQNYEVSIISAHNARFDYNSCQKTQRWLTSSKCRWFFPYGIEIWDSLKMARQTFAKSEDYKKFCLENGFCCNNGNPRLTAEILYKYLSKNIDFIESHTGLEDVLIEKEIVKACLQMNPLIECRLWG